MVTGRIIIIAAAIVVGVMIGLASFAVVRPVGVNPDMPVFERTDLPPSDLSTTRLLPRMSEERRRQRARQLVGEPMQYVAAGRLLHPTWIKRMGSEALDRMMDECFLLTDETLLALHLKAVAAAKMDPSEVGHPLDHVAKSQLQSCRNVVKVYDETHRPPA
jgi:hypothetical protein